MIFLQHEKIHLAIEQMPKYLFNKQNLKILGIFSAMTLQEYLFKTYFLKVNGKIIVDVIKAGYQYVILFHQFIDKLISLSEHKN